MKDVSGKYLTTPAIKKICKPSQDAVVGDLLDHCLERLLWDDHRIADEIVDGLTYGVLVGALLLAKEKLEKQ